MKQVSVILLFLSFFVWMSCENTLEDNTGQESADSSMCSVDLKGISESFDKLVWKDSENFSLVKRGESELQESYIIVSNSDTLTIICDEVGLPKVISNKETYVIIGGYSGKNLNFVCVDKTGESEVETLQLDIDVSFESYLIGTQTKADNDQQQQNLKHLITKRVIEEIMPFEGTKFGNPLFVMEFLSYLASPNETWQDCVHSTFKWTGVSVTILETMAGGTPTGALILANFDIWYNDVYLPLKRGGYILPASDPRSAYASEITYYYQQIDSMLFRTGSHTFSWLGDEFDNEIIITGARYNNGAVYNVQPEDIIILSHANWVVPKVVARNGRLFLNVSVGNNADEGSRPRSDYVKVRWSGADGLGVQASFKVYQTSRPYAEPDAITFWEDSTTELVMIYSDDEWIIRDKPEWCIISDVTKVSFVVSKDKSYDSPQKGEIVVDVKVGEGSFPVRISVDPGPTTRTFYFSGSRRYQQSADGAIISDSIYYDWYAYLVQETDGSWVIYLGGNQHLGFYQIMDSWDFITAPSDPFGWPDYFRYTSYNQSYDDARIDVSAVTQYGYDRAEKTENTTYSRRTRSSFSFSFSIVGLDGNKPSLTAVTEGVENTHVEYDEYFGEEAHHSTTDTHMTYLIQESASGRRIK